MLNTDLSAELAALPPMLRGLGVSLQHAGIALEVEKHRNIIREDDLRRARARYNDALMAYEAAERKLAEEA